jgi:hypothetical protein
MFGCSRSRSTSLCFACPDRVDAVRLSQDARNLGRRRGPASISICLQFLLAASAMFTSIPRAHAFNCLTSAEAVRKENPTAWPTWTLRAPGHEGGKCWYASTRGAVRDHRNPLPRTEAKSRTDVVPKTAEIARTEGVGDKEQSDQEVEVTSSLAPTVPVREPAAGPGSFDDRFSAIGDGSPPGGSKFQQVIDLFIGGARNP